MTQIEMAKKGIISEEMRKAAEADSISPELLRDLIASGRAVLPKNVNHSFEKILAIGEKLRTKVNANIGSSGACASVENELAKLEAALSAGTDSVMDLSTGGDLETIRAKILEKSTVMVGTVPIYAVAARLNRNNVPIYKMDIDELFKSIEDQCRQGVDYITVHCGITRETIKRIEGSNRVIPSVSRGGSILLQWMKHNNKENPLYEYFDDLLEIAYRYDVTLSLGDGMRPGTIVDATDRPQIEELILLGELARKSREKNVQAMIEGPGHVPLDQISANVLLEKRLCDGAPFYLLGPLPTDIAPGYDHITAAIGGAIAAAAGADFLCYVTPAEHLALPTAEDVYVGVVASRIAGHAADIVKGVPGAIEKDRLMSIYRRDLNWKGMLSVAIDPQEARKRLALTHDRETCTMCGELCAVKLSRGFLKKDQTK
ncbi:MAG: phosphomethylpyrimidine synthase ThiC [Syntrophobacterales bacterium]|nr:phosphomethylpyrimidine synthase ThiC [Syntrophobacterales bacterium]